MRLISSLILILCLAACQRSGQNNSDAVRQGIVDHLTKAGINVAGMDLNVASVQFNGEKADASVTITVKGQSGSTPMPFTYHLEHQNNKWVVIGRATETGHGGAVDPNAGAPNPHGGTMPPAAGGSGKMPSPQDMPPSKKK